MSRKGILRKVSRRALLAGTAAGAAVALGRFPAPAIAQAAPFKLGLLTVKTGPLAQGGNQMEQGVLTFLKETDYTMAGRKVELEMCIRDSLNATRWPPASSTATLSGARLLSRPFFSAASTMVEACARVTDIFAPTLSDEISFLAAPRPIDRLARAVTAA